MTVRFASFNVENLFARPKAFNTLTWSEGRPILQAYAEFNDLTALWNYTPAVKRRMIELLLRLEIYRDDNGIVRRSWITNPQWAWLQANRGAFDVEHEEKARDRRQQPERLDRLGGARDRADYRDRRRDDGKGDPGRRCRRPVRRGSRKPPITRPIQSRAVARPLRARDAHRWNGTRGIDVGLMVRAPVEILSMKSNVDVPDTGAAGEHPFSRDCAEYECQLSNGAVVRVLLNHFKSQSGGGDDKAATSG
jgi:hypothetical protein